MSEIFKLKKLKESHSKILPIKFEKWRFTGKLAIIRNVLHVM